MFTDDGCGQDSTCFNLDMGRNSPHLLYMAIRLSVWQHLCIAINQANSIIRLALNDKVKKYINEDKLIDADTENGTNLTITQVFPKFSSIPVNQPRINHLSDLRLYNQEISEEDMNHYINNCSGDLQNSAQPVLTLDSDLLQVKGSAQLTNISEEQVCASVQPMSIFFNRRHNFKKAQDWCSQLGGSLPLPESHETNTFFYNQALKSRRGCDDYSILYWLDAVNNASGDFYKMTDGKPLKWINLWSWGRNNFEILCLVIDNRRFNKGSDEWRLTSCRRPSCGVLCSFDYSPWLKLQEITSEMDTPLGRHWWRVWQSGCSQDKMLLVLSACGAKEYTCNDGTCINMNKRCNLILECPDHSDEEHCEKVLLPHNYYPRLPLPSTVQRPFQLRLTLSISSVRSFAPPPSLWLLIQTSYSGGLIRDLHTGIFRPLTMTTQCQT
ncbi:hypothetical protein Pmani_008930 [Petrolisthes manimaculis]|uniref:C-type lectin domain-containing protein n=1 Tax=Petrolisthes manimaculis TaxID=1843537 RepID=A0AAE1UH87_9EUCA|nr:hypothetical protein Pmani_008930 [Petrolisthes manimaculis]